MVTSIMPSRLKTLSYTGGGDVTHEILDENYNSAETIHVATVMRRRRTISKCLPNGNVLQLDIISAKWT